MHELNKYFNMSGQYVLFATHMTSFRMPIGEWAHRNVTQLCIGNKLTEPKGIFNCYKYALLRCCTFSSRILLSETSCEERLPHQHLYGLPSNVWPNLPFFHISFCSRHPRM